ncbi:MAG TPA: hypothetical protein VGC76_01450 [Pyrinomonadaceae bacterium]|jgi:hypothetical protein
MQIKFFALALLFLLTSFETKAAIRPSFSLEYSAWNATEVVVATEGDEIDGNFTVLENLKGELYTNQTISVPELASFKSDDSRLVEDEWDSDEKTTAPRYVSGAKMILFLKKDARSDKWKSAALFGDMNVSVVWLEAGKAFGFIQVMNPGASVLIELEKSETEIRDKAFEIIELQNSFNNVLKIKDKAKRAEALERFVYTDTDFIRQNALDELQKCGKSALTILRKMLADESLLKIHADIIESLAKAGGEKIGGELIKIVGEELKFWKATATVLKEDWWNNMEDYDKTENLRNRYSKTLEAIRQLKNLKFAASRKIVTEFRDFWRSQPQLEDKNGLSQMSETCDELLAATSQNFFFTPPAVRHVSGENRRKSRKSKGRKSRASRTKAQSAFR